MRKVALVLAILSACPVALSRPAPKDRRTEALLAELGDPRTTDWAAHELRILAQRDRAQRGHITPRICELLARPETDKVWTNAVRLAGSLKLSETVHLLAEGMQRGPTGKQPDGFYDTDRLNDDIVARSLAQIGEPAIPAVADLLQGGDIRMRRRAVGILVYMHSAAAQKVLRDHLPHEADPQIRRTIQLNLESQAAGSRRR